MILASYIVFLLADFCMDMVQATGIQQDGLLSMVGKNYLHLCSLVSVLKSRFCFDDIHYVQSDLFERIFFDDPISVDFVVGHLGTLNDLSDHLQPFTAWNSVRLQCKCGICRDE